MLTLTRREGESIRIFPNDNVDQSMTLGELFADGPVELIVSKVKGRQISLSFKAPRELAILRDEVKKKAVPEV